jgi:hypothetical protein
MRRLVSALVCLLVVQFAVFFFFFFKALVGSRGYGGGKHAGEEGILLFNTRKRGRGEGEGYSCQLVGKRMTANVTSGATTTATTRQTPTVTTVKGYAIVLLSDGRMQVRSEIANSERSWSSCVERERDRDIQIER